MDAGKIKIIILAAGKGKRMKSEEPKALTKLQGKPFLKHILETLNKFNPEIKPIIVVGYKKERILEVFGDEYIYAVQEEQLGTGHAVMSAQNAIDSPHETILILSTDQPLISKETLTRIFSVHYEKKPTITLGTVVVPDYENWRAGLYSNFGRVVRTENGQVEKLVEFKNANDEEKKIKEVNPAIYLFDAKWLWENIKKIQLNKERGEYLFTDIIKIAFDQNKRIEAVPVANIIEGLQPNSQEELEILEKLIV